jgi:hypothetical protein
LLSLERRKLRVGAEDAEIRRGLTLIAVVLLGAALVAAVTAEIVDSGVTRPGATSSS